MWQKIQQTKKGSYFAYFDEDTAKELHLEKGLKFSWEAEGRESAKLIINR